MDLFSLEHLLVLAATVVLCVAAPLVARRRPGSRWLRSAAQGLAAALVLNELALRVVILTTQEWSWATDLPLHLTDAALIAAAVALWTESPLAFELTYFWAFTATLQAVITPDLGHGPDHYFFWAFVISHSGVLLGASYLAWGRRMVPRPGAVRRVYGLSVAWACVAAIGSAASGGNYMFLREKPSEGSLLDLFGPWPWYIGAAALFALALFLVLDRLRRWSPPRWRPGRA